MKWINYSHLYYFKVIAEEMSISKASKKLRLGQPTLSAQLKQFEINIGVRLFERVRKRLVITEQGQVALDYAKTIFGLGNEMYEILQNKISPKRLHLRIGALDSIPKQITLQVAKFAYKQHNCRITFIEGHESTLLRELTSHRIDLAITDNIPDTETQKLVQYRKVYRSNLSIYGSPHFRHIKKKFPRSLDGQKMIMAAPNTKHSNDIIHWFKVKKVKVDPIAETQDIALKKIMATEGIGLIAASEHSVTRQIQRGELLKIGDLPGLSEELYFVTADRQHEHPVASSIFSHFRLK